MPRAVIYLGCLLPVTSSGSPSLGREKTNLVPPTLLPTGVSRASTSQYCWCALTVTFAPLPFQISDFREKDPFTVTAVCFCGTILTLARTGRYPASLVFREPGLSSEIDPNCFGLLCNCRANSPNS